MPRPDRPPLWRALTYLSVVRLVLLSVERSVYPFLPAIARGLGIPLGQAGLLLSARSVGGLTAPLTVAVAGRRGHHQRLAAIGLVLFAAGALLATIPGSYGWALAGFVVLGAARPAYDAAAQAYLADRSPYARRARVLAVLELMYAGGLLLGAPAAGWAIARWDWRAPFVAGAGAAVVALALLPTSLEPTHGEGGSGDHPLRVDGHVVRLLVTMALFTFGAELTVVVFGAWLEGGFGLSLLALGGVSTVVGLAELSGEGLTLGVADRLGKRRTVALGLAVSAGAFAVLAVVGDALTPGLAAIAVALAGFEVAIVATIPIVSEVRPLARARMLALGGVAMFAGRAVAAAVAPAIFDRFGIAGNATGSALAYAVALLALATVPDHADRPPGHADPGADDPRRER